MKLELIDFGARNEGRLPIRAYRADAGADIIANKSYFLWPLKTINIPLGFGFSDLPAGTMAVIKPRSSAAKAGLMCHETPIDAEYTGECHAQITNVSLKFRRVRKGERIGQLVIQPVIMPQLTLGGKQYDFSIKPRRKSKGLGSSGKY